MPRKFDRDEHHLRRHGMVVKSEYQGWSNWETWNVNMMLDNNYEFYKSLQGKWENLTDEALRAVALINIIGPHNKEKIEDAQNWNEVPLEERFGTDPNYEQLRDKHEDSPAWNLMMNSPEDHYKDEDPSDQIIDPELVNWREIILFHRVESTRDENGDSPYEDH
jgi:hypothetical protein